VLANCEDVGMIHDIPVDKDYIPLGSEHKDKEVKKAGESKGLQES